MLRISLDFDAVLSDTHKEVIRHCNETNDSDIVLGDICGWDFEGVELTTDDYIEVSKYIWRNNWSDIPPMEESVSSKVRSISEVAHVDIVTSRHYYNHGEMCLWLNKHNVFNFNRFIHRDDKVNLDYDIFIDDNPLMAGEVDMLFLRDRPWNRHVEEGGCVRRIESLSDVPILMERHV